MSEANTADVLNDILHLRTIKHIDEAAQKRRRFVHYSSAEAAMKMISSKMVWMRQATAMNDFMEIEYGFEKLNKTYKSELGKRFQAAIASVTEGVTAQVEAGFNELLMNVRRGGAYLTCISEHDDAEDINGRLSMWRAYGGDSGVAVVMSGAPFLTPSDALGAYTFPVCYDDDQLFELHFKEIVERVEAKLDVIKQASPETLVQHVIFLFAKMMLTTKHPGFKEEREWRVVYLPYLYDRGRLKKKVECIGGVPQPIVAIPLKDIPEEGFVGAELPALIDRVIIGPARFPNTIQEAFIDLLQSAGVDEAYNKVWVSNIPLRK